MVWLRQDNHCSLVDGHSCVASIAALVPAVPTSSYESIAAFQVGLLAPLLTSFHADGHLASKSKGFLSMKPEGSPC